MTAPIEPTPIEPALSHRPKSLASTLLLWLVAGAVLLACVRLASVSRTQEARVLETAREMLNRPFVDWMIPHTNGDVRLHKPPLAYWLTAGAFKIFGVAAWAGRLPMALAGWGTIGLTYLIARRMFDHTAALFAGAALLGSWLFFKNTLLAETDALAMFLVTGGVYAVLRAVDAPRAWRWQHLIAICMALAILAKGPPGAYIALFYVVLCATRRDAAPLRSFVLSGAIGTLIVLAIPWFIYVAHSVGMTQLRADLKNSAEGGKGHAAWPQVYVPMFAKAALPWTAMWAVAIAAALRHVGRRMRPWQGMDATATLLLWGLVIGLPLMCWGNKQEHYLLPLMPPTMILVGYGIAGAITNRGRFHDLSRIILAVTAGALGLLPLLPPIVARIAPDQPGVRAIDWLACGILVIVVSIAFWLARRDRWPGVAWAAAVLAVALVCTLAFEGRTIDRWPTERLADEVLRVYPDGHFIFRHDPSLSLCFALNRTIPVMDDDALTAKAAADKKLVCLERIDSEPTSAPPVGLIEAGRIGQQDQQHKSEWLRVFVPGP